MSSTITTTATRATSAWLPPRFGVGMTQVGEAMWRVSRPGGDVVGHIERLPGSDGDRFWARRLLPRSHRYLSLGEYWSIDDAIACFRQG